MKKYKFYILLLSLILCHPSIFSQGFLQIIDGSFEEPGDDPTKSNLPRKYWQRSCDSEYTPDRQPGFWGVTEKPYHGKQFLGLITKSIREYASQLIDMEKNEDYFLVMYLASSKGYGPNGHRDEGTLNL